MNDASAIDPEDLPLLLAVLERSVRDAAEMALALQGGDWAPVVQLAHRMAGATGAFGLAEVAGTSRELERAARAADAPKSRALLEQLAAALARARATAG